MPDKVFSSEQIKQGFAEFKEQADQLYATKDELDDKQDTLTFDDAPTQGSNNPVKSGGIYTALGNKQDTIAFNTTYNPSTNKAATMDDINSAITGVYKVKGGATVTSLNGLTITESMNGDVYNITTGGTLTNYSGSITVAAGDNVVLVWNSGSWYWDKLASTVDLSGYAQSNTNISSSSKGVALGGTIGNPTIVVTGGSVTDGNTSVVDGGTVYAALSGKQNTLTTSSVNDGTINKVIGFDSNGNLVKDEGGGGSAITPNPSSSSTEQLEKATIGSTVYQVQNIELSNTDYISDITLNYDDSTSETIEGVLLIENNAIYLEVE